MTREQSNVKEFMLSAGQDCPETPTIPPFETRRLRARLILEEVLETLDAMGVDVNVTATDSTGFIKNKLKLDILNFEDSGKVDLIEVIDGLCDTDYINQGTATCFGVDLEPYQIEVHKTNMEKFGPGSYRDLNGKWIKPPNWKKPDLASILNKN